MSFISRPNIWSGVARGQTRIKHRFMKWVITINFHSIQGVIWCNPINANWWHRKKTNLCRNVFHSEFDDVRGIWLYRFNYWRIARVLSGQWSNPIQFNQFINSTHFYAYKIWAVVWDKQNSTDFQGCLWQQALLELLFNLARPHTRQSALNKIYCCLPTKMTSDSNFQRH